MNLIYLLVGVVLGAVIGAQWVTNSTLVKMIKTDLFEMSEFVETVREYILGDKKGAK